MTSMVGTDYLVLWKYSEALYQNGRMVTGARSTHASGLRKGDCMFVVATNRDELYLLGVLKVQRSGKKWADATSLSGRFRIIPLRGLKWQLRFLGTLAVKLGKKTYASKIRQGYRRHPTHWYPLARLVSISH